MLPPRQALRACERLLFACQAAYQAEYFQSNFKADKGLDWEVGSTSSRTGSEASIGEFKNVAEEMRHKLYYA